MNNADFFESVAAIAAELEIILVEESLAHSNLAFRLRTLARERPDRLFDAYCSLSWWGAAGSMADLVPTDKSTRRRHMELLVSLVRAFEAEGHQYPRARSTADIFERWLADDLV